MQDSQSVNALVPVVPSVADGDVTAQPPRPLRVGEHHDVVSRRRAQNNAIGRGVVKPQGEKVIILFLSRLSRSPTIHRTSS